MAKSADDYRRELEAARHKVEQARRDAEAAERARLLDEEKDAEKERLTKPMKVYTGATYSNKSPILVWHVLAEPPADLDMKTRRAGLGALLALRHGGGSFTASDAVYGSLKARFPSIAEDHPEFVQQIKNALTDAYESYPCLTKLRDDEFMADLLEKAGVADEDKTTKTEVGTYDKYSRSVTTITVPELIEAQIKADGLVLVYKHRLGDSAKEWVKKIDTLKSALRAGLKIDTSELTIDEDDDSNIRLRFRDRDPFKGAVITSGEFDAAKGRSLLGITSTGAPAWVTWNGSSGMVVGGVPGSGKTASMLPVFAGMAGKAELHVFDGKAGFDLLPLKRIARTYDATGDIDAPLEVLRQLDELRPKRAEYLFKTLKANNFWNVPLEMREQIGMTPIFVILDEVQTWLDASSAIGKEEKAILDEIKKLIRTLIQKARSVGIILVLTTQKPDSTSVPTVIRDNAALKAAFRVSTPEQAICVLGKLPENADPTQIPMAAKGRGAMETDGFGVVLFQSGYKDNNTLDAELANSEPVTDQTALVESLTHGHPVQPAPRFEDAVREQPAPTETPAEVIVPTPPPFAMPAAPAREQPQPQPNTNGSKPKFDDDALLAALAEAQKRGLIKPPQQSTAAPTPLTEVPAPVSADMPIYEEE